MVSARKHNFSPCVKPYCPSPSVRSIDETTEDGSSNATPKLMVPPSPSLSTPGCNPQAKPFIPSCVLSSVKLPQRQEDKGSISVAKMLMLRGQTPPIDFGASVPNEVLSTSPASSWVSEACRYIYESDATSSTPSLEAHDRSDDDNNVTSPPPSASLPLTSLSFMRTKPRVVRPELARKVRLQESLAKEEKANTFLAASVSA
ncbi:hypothetical protein DIPPA_05218 [Diplonema papillatum]|nr:hypothetical protein DIPPA_05218 [Diplonema papillatum]